MPILAIFPCLRAWRLAIQREIPIEGEPEGLIGDINEDSLSPDRGQGEGCMVADFKTKWSSQSRRDVIISGGNTKEQG